MPELPMKCKIRRLFNNFCLWKTGCYIDFIQYLKYSIFLQGSSEGTEEQNEEIFRKLSSDLLSIAKRHEGYQTLWNMCCDLNDSELLKSLMVLGYLFTFFLLLFY